MLFPNTHILFARDVLGNLNNEIVLGAVFPDTVIAGFIDHRESHHQGLELHNYLTRTGVLEDFAKGLLTHGTTPKGLDFYCDVQYGAQEQGYAFQAAVPLVSKVIKTGFPEEMGLWKAHNFIEMAAELWLCRQNNFDYDCLAKALDDQDLILDIGYMLSPFFEVPAGKIAMAFAVYGEYVLSDQLTSLELAKKYGMQTLKKHNIQIDVPAAAEIIEEALEIIKPTISEFMDFSTKQVKTEISQL